MQAEGLAEVCRLVRAERPVDIICFSGFTLERLRSHPPSTGVDDLLAQIDVLIDGPYIESMNDNRGMRGSSNQCIHHLTDRLKSYDFQSMPRLAEVLIRDEEMMVAGVPPTHFLKAVKSIN